MSIRFAAIGLNHAHVYIMCRQLMEVGAEMVAFFATEPDLVAPFQQQYPGVKLARSEAEILEDESIHLVCSAAIPNERAPLGLRVMRHGKDYLADKPGFTSLEQLAEARRVQAETQRIYSILFSERFTQSSAVKAGELVHAGAIGQVIQMMGMGPHRLGNHPRPDWFYDARFLGGILNDLASHQIDQYLFYAGLDHAEIVASQVANYHHAQHPAFEDFGDVMLRGEGSSAYIRVDWFTPDGLGGWGDARKFIVGTDGYIELRKVIDIAGRPGKNHLFLVNQRGIEYMDCTNVPLVYGGQLVHDVLNRTETAMTQQHAFLTSELALRAQLQADRLGYLAESSLSS